MSRCDVQEGCVNYGLASLRGALEEFVQTGQHDDDGCIERTQFLQSGSWRMRSSLVQAAYCGLPSAGPQDRSWRAIVSCRISSMAEQPKVSHVKAMVATRGAPILIAFLLIEEIVISFPTS